MHGCVDKCVGGSSCFNLVVAVAVDVSKKSTTQSEVDEYTPEFAVLLEMQVKITNMPGGCIPSVLFTRFLRLE